MENTEQTHLAKRPHEDIHDTQSAPPALPRPKRPKTSKACNACRKQKSRCEKLAGDSDGCHRCGVIGIPCIFDSDLASTDGAKVRKPRPILPRERKAESAQVKSVERRPSPPDTAGLHVLANTTAMLSREPDLGSRGTDSFPRPTASRATVTPKSTLSPETLSTVESTLFPAPRDSTVESESARFRADWRRWVAPLTLLQTLMPRRNRASNQPVDANWQQPARPVDTGVLTATQERCLKEHFRVRYLPWLPCVRLAKNGAANNLDDVSPFLTTVICATASRTLAETSVASMEHLHSLALHHVGLVFANPSAHPLVDSLYALLILVLWPLDAADDVALLIHGAKRLASAYERGRGVSGGDSHAASQGGKSEDDLDHIRLWYTICASETILTLGAGSTTTPLDVDDLAEGLGSASELALRSGCTPDILLILQTNLHTIVTAAMRQNSYTAKGAPSIPKGREPVLHYISTVHMALTRLGEWEIEFYTISSECERSDAVYYAILEIEYHYLCLMFVTHCLLTLCHACPLVSASDEVKFALWSWSITGNKGAHALIRLFNTYSAPESERKGENEASLAPLATAPDRIYAKVVVAVMLILRHQVASYEYGRRRGLVESPPAGFTKQAEKAIRRAIERMGTIGRARTLVDGAQVSACDHAAARYAEILEALLRIWEEKRAQKVASVAAPADHAFTSTESGCHGDAAHQPLHEPLHDAGDADHLGSMQMDIDLSLLGGDLFSNTSFPWDGLGALDWGGIEQ